MGTTRIESVYLLDHAGHRPAQEDQSRYRLDRGVFVVADGFGGPSVGVQAAQTACESVLRFLEKEAGDDEATFPFLLRSFHSLAGNVLYNALVHANRRVLALNRGAEVNARGGASVVSAFIESRSLIVANVGGTGASLIRAGREARLVLPKCQGRTHDPFWGEAEREPSPLESAPWIALGIGEDFEPELVECRLEPWDWVLLYTDGLRAELRSRIALAQLRGEPLEDVLGGLKRELEAEPPFDNALLLAMQVSEIIE